MSFQHPARRRSQSASAGWQAPRSQHIAASAARAYPAATGSAQGGRFTDVMSPS